ncbi:MAG: hypothetical protein FD123_2040 [Bacteroidetes bacterium]|nr:MAG: hypothetical protein FD123_2040 [Bacteroidota bacterium]
MNKLLQRFPVLKDLRLWAVLFFVVTVAASLHRYYLGNINNFEIFRYSFLNLLDGVDLYTLHPAQHEDLFKYSPTFALFMAPFSFLPVGLGIVLWNLLNVFVLFFAVKRLQLSGEKKLLILLFCFIELLTSIQSSQSNGLMAGLMIMAFAMMEEKRPWMAALLICFGFYIKIFAVVVAVLFLFYEKKGQFILAMIAWGILFAVLPALVSGIDGLIMQYESWLNLLANDPAHELNYSVMTVVQRWSGLEISDIYYLVPGVILLLLPFLRKNTYRDPAFRMLMLASVLIWVVIFNHKAESPTYAIAMCGAGIWLVLQEKTKWTIAFAVFVFVFTGLIATDLFPASWRSDFFRPYAIKAVPCILLWLYVQYLLLTVRTKENT